jgi:SAM-dependent methyltransferase
MIYKALEIPSIYRFVRWLFNADRVPPILLSGLEYRPGLRVLDIGCGTGELAQCFEPDDYVGIDISESYIRAAQQRYHGKFQVLSAEHSDRLRIAFDRVFVVGVFHHLPDEKVAATLSAVTNVLKPEGYALIIEAVWSSRWWDLPNYVFRWLDRGKHVRSESQWRALLGASWRLEKTWFIHKGLLEDFIVVLRPPNPTVAKQVLP